MTVPYPSPSLGPLQGARDARMNSYETLPLSSSGPLLPLAKPGKLTLALSLQNPLSESLPVSLTCCRFLPLKVPRAYAPRFPQPPGPITAGLRASRPSARVHGPSVVGCPSPGGVEPGQFGFAAMLWVKHGGDPSSDSTCRVERGPRVQLR